MTVLYVVVAFGAGVLVGLMLWEFIAAPKLERAHVAELEKIVETALQYGNCDDCSARGPLFDKTNHHGGMKRVCRDRDACHSRSRG